MYFHVIMPSRNNPTGLISVTKAMKQLESGMHEVDYTWVVDEDDDSSLILDKFVEELDVYVDVQGSDKNLYARINKIADEIDAECTMVMNDDIYPLTQDWDYLAAMINSPLFSWREMNSTGTFNYPFVRSQWRKELGYIFSERFPFWFVDSWLAEVFMMATDCSIPVINALKLGGKRGLTRGLRDLEFWFKYYQATRKIRIQDAEKIKGEKVHENAASCFEEIDKMHLSKVNDYTKYHGAKEGEPSQRYVTAKKDAELWMKQNC